MTKGVKTVKDFTQSVNMGLQSFTPPPIPLTPPTNPYQNQTFSPFTVIVTYCFLCFFSLYLYHICTFRV